jgi:hypothetical protein
VITNCDHLARLKLPEVAYRLLPDLFEALSLRLRLAAAQCGKPMAFRAPSLTSFPEAQPQEKNYRTRPRKGRAFPQCAAAKPRTSANDYPGFQFGYSSFYDGPLSAGCCRLRKLNFSQKCQREIGGDHKL